MTSNKLIDKRFSVFAFAEAMKLAMFLGEDDDEWGYYVEPFNPSKHIGDSFRLSSASMGAGEEFVIEVHDESGTFLGPL